jgi:FG-GAP-like repeat/FG-GAP repeat
LPHAKGRPASVPGKGRPEACVTYEYRAGFDVFLLQGMRKSHIFLFLSLMVVIGAGFFGINHIYASGPSFSFSGTSFATGQTSPGVLAVGDFNGDGAPDAVVTSNGGIVEFKGQLTSGQPNGSLGNVQTSALSGCGTLQNVAVGSNSNYFLQSPVLYGTVSTQAQMARVQTSSGWFSTTANCDTTSPNNVNFQWLATGDFNRDGYGDGVIVTNSNAILLAPGSSFGTGITGYSVSVPLPSPLTNATRVITGDFNGDGRTDIIVGAGTDIAFFPGQAVTTGGLLSDAFTTATASSVSIGAGPAITRVLLADANGDGKPDIVATRGNAVVVIPGNNTGAFGAQVSVSLPANYTANATAVADFNGDGLPDLLVAASDSNLTTNNVLLVFAGAGTPGGAPAFAAVQTVPIGGGGNLNPVDVVAADMDRDGRMDLVVSTQADGNVWVLLNTVKRLVITNSTSLDFHAVIGQASPAPVTLTIGTSDLAAVPALSVTTSPLRPALSWVAQSVSGNLVTIAPNISTAPGTGLYRGMAVVTGAGYMQVQIPYTVTIVQQTGTVLRGGESGTQATGLPNGGTASSWAVGDFNGDGIPDVASSSVMGCTSTYYGIFTRMSDQTGYNAPTCANSFSTFANSIVAAAPADFNGDGKLDVVAVTGLYYGFVGFGGGDGTFTNRTWYTIPPGANGVAVADLNGDGYPDIVITAGGGGNPGGIAVMLNDGTGAFSVSTIRSGHQYYSPAIADFNGDGIPDVAVRNQTSSSEWGLEVFLGQGSGRFASPQAVSFAIGGCAGTAAQCTRPTVQTNMPISLALVAADFNNDGLADLAFIDKPDSGQPLGPAVVVALASIDISHNVSFNLTTQGPIAQTTYQLPYYLVAGDVDGDGNIDLAFEKTGGSGAGVAYRLGNGDGTFPNESVVTQLYTSIGTNTPLILTDLDGDGRLDMVGPNVAYDYSGTATGLWMGSKVPTTLAFNGVPASAAALTTENITFQGTLTLSPGSLTHWVRSTAANITFYDNYPSAVGTGLPTLTATNTMVGSYSGAVSVGTHAFEARFPGDNRLSGVNSGVYAPGLAFSTQPSSTTVGVAMSLNPVVRVMQPGTSSTDTTFNGPVSIGLDHGSFSSGVVTTVNAVNGFATFNSVKIAQGGTFYLTAMAGSTLVNSNSFQVTGGPADHLVVTGLPANPVAGAQQTVQVQIQDSGNSPAGNYTGKIHFTTSDPAASLPADYTFSLADNSTKSFNLTLKTTGAQTLTVTDTVNSTLTQTLNPTVVAGTATTVTLNAPSPVAINTAFGTLIATVTDQYSNPLANTTVTFATVAGGSGANGSLSGGGVTTTDSNGQAGITVTANNKAGTFTVTGTAAGSTSAPRTLTITNGPAASLSVIGGANQATPVNSAFGTPFQVQALDAGGNAVPGFSVTFTSPASGASCGYPSALSTSISTDASGVATVTCTANATQGAYAVTASGTGVSPVSITGLANQTGSAASLTVVAGTPQSATVATVFATPFQVKLKDIGGNPISGQTITFRAPASGASGNFSGSATATANTDAAGIATAPAFTANTQSGSYQVTASFGALSAGLSVTNNPGAAALISIVAGDNQTAGLGSAFATALAVKITDQYQNPVSGASVTFAAPASGASGSFAGTATAVTNASGVATAPAFTANNTTGSYMVSASAGALSVNFHLTNVLVPTAGIAVYSGSGQGVPANTAFQPLVARVFDINGKGVPNASVTFTLPSTGPSATFTGGSRTFTTTTDSQGLATSAGLIAGTQIGSFTATAATGAFQTTFSLAILGPTPYSVEPSVLIFRYEVGQALPAAQTALVTSPYNTFTVSVDSPWLKAAIRPNGSANNMITVAVDPTGMAPGNYTGMVSISGEAFVRVSLQVVPKPQIVPNTKSVAFQYRIGDPAPAEQMVYITATTRNFNITVTPTGGNWLHISGGGSTVTPAALHVSVIPDGLDPGIYQGAIHVETPDATNSPYDVSVTLTVLPAPVTVKPPEIAALVNSASGASGPVSGNEIVTLYGTGLACDAPEVLVNDASALILAATATQINFVVPGAVAPPQASVVFRCGAAVSLPAVLSVASHAPGIFTRQGSQVSAYNQGFVLNGPDAPVGRGGVVMLFGTGFGASAAVNGGLSWLATPVTVTIGGVAAEVLFAGDAPGLPGVTQINVRIPMDAALGSAVPITVTQDGMAAQAGLTLAVN